MPFTPSPETFMSTVPSPEMITIPTFALPWRAPPPIIVPLFSTTVRSRRGTALAIHEDLIPKPRFYHPYRHTKRSTSSNAPAPTSDPSSSKSGSTALEPEPGSPLTPMTEEQPVDASCNQMEPRIILAPPPSGTLLISKLGLEEAVARDYRVSLFTILSICTLLTAI